MTISSSPANHTPHICAALADKIDHAGRIIEQAGSVIVAFSGGVDSAFLLKLAVDRLGTDRVLAVTGQSESLAAREREDATSLAAMLGVTHEFIETNEIADPNYAANPHNRCYYCKTHLYGQLTELARQRGIHAVLCGTNADDTGDYRPGMQAADEYGILSPALQAGMTKQDIRTACAAWKLPVWDKPASPCLASRMAYHTLITPARLTRVEQAEEFIKSLGVKQLRVRDHEQLARIELPADQIERFAAEPLRTRVADHLKQLGYTFVTIDLGGFRSGSMNDVLPDDHTLNL